MANASRSLVTEPRLAISISRPSHAPSSLRAWGRVGIWSLGLALWHLSQQVPLPLKQLMSDPKMSSNQPHSTQSPRACLRTVTARQVGPELSTGAMVPRDPGVVPLGPLQKEKENKEEPCLGFHELGGYPVLDLDSIAGPLGPLHCYRLAMEPIRRKLEGTGCMLCPCPPASWPP